jgi:hypothetical protein
METVTTNDVTREAAAMEPEDKENLAVLRSKRLVILAMVAAAAIVATLVYLVAANDEHGNFTKDVSVMENRVPFFPPVLHESPLTNFLWSILTGANV